MVTALGFLYGSLFQQPLENYLPYLAAGFVVWGLIASLINDGTRAFTDCEGLIRQLSVPLSVYVFRSVWTNLLIFLHNIVVFFLVAIVFVKWPGWSILLAIPALALILFNGIWLSLLLGLISARFRDVPQIIASIVQVMFFMTPILWTADMLPQRALLLEANPFYHAVELLRAPLLGEAPTPVNWFVAILISIAGWCSTLTLYTAYRWRIAYWV
jgi:ABC-2 type transport system permease protein/lipopolysaccharide transport system permease protein